MCLQDTETQTFHRNYWQCGIILTMIVDATYKLIKLVFPISKPEISFDKPHHQLHINFTGKMWPALQHSKIILLN